jgi:HD-GYP domain-containing protein (c-di-GMP phosphodiesterase class II)
MAEVHGGGSSFFKSHMYRTGEGLMDDTMQNNAQEMVQLIAAIMERADPFTAVHQRRVTELTSAIAAEMGLSQNTKRCLYVSAMIHDIGNLRIPMARDLLERPGSLTDREFAMVKIHPREGYKMLKSILFPWPVADIVLQHHEMLDGSGYPEGLKGDDILWEARIIRVADTVEAMMSDRPHRPSRGVEAVIDELSDKRGVTYDPDAVDACLSLLGRDFTFYAV